MNEKSKNLIKEEMANLPKEIQEAINTSNWEKVSEEIGKKYLLDEDETETLQLETACFLLGLVDEDSYPTNIEDEVGTSKAEAEKISEEVFQKIFIPINNKLEENIKRNLPNKNPDHEQNLDFILSGGDYSAFIAPTTENFPPLLNNVDSPHPNPLLVKEREGEEEKPRITDMKNKFTI